MEQGAISNRRPGAPRIHPDAVVADKAYSNRPIREYLAKRGIDAVIPTKVDQLPQRNFRRAAYRKRNIIERFFARISTIDVSRLVTRNLRRAL